MARHIGIVACSAEGAALAYRTICTEAPETMGRFAHPEITMHTPSFSEYMARMKGRGAQAAVLGCTEIPLLVDPGDTPLPVLDSTRLLARAALEHALA